MINTGRYYGQGLVSVGSGSSSTVAGQRVPTASNITAMSRNTAANYAQPLQIIHQYLKNGETDNAIKEYEKLIDEIQALNSGGIYTINESQCSSILNRAYQITTGNTFMDDVDKKTANPFVSGLAQGIPLVGFFVNDITSAEALAKIAGNQAPAKDKFKEYLGAAATGAATGAAIGTAVGGWAFGLGTAIGAGVGAIVSMGQTLIKDLF